MLLAAARLKRVHETYLGHPREGASHKQPKMVYIGYTGIGADESGIHTKKRFLHIVKKYKPVFDLMKLSLNESIGPEPETLDEWVEEAGAVYLQKIPQGHYYCPSCGRIE